MEYREQAIEARKYYTFDDRDGTRKQELGDRKAEINLLVKTNI